MTAGEHQKVLGEIIIADDDEAFLDILTKTFRRDFIVHAVTDGTRALELVHKTQPAALLMDEMMPGLTGTQVLAEAKERRPNAARMLMTASTDFDRAVSAINQGEIHRFFAKPLRPVELRQAVLDVVERIRNEELLRVELETLRGLKDTAVTRQVRVLAVTGAPELVTHINAACKLRGYAILCEELVAAAQTVLTNRSADVLVIGGDVQTDPRALVTLARSVDESMAILVMDPLPTLAAATEAMELGVNDFISAPFPSDEALAARLERAVHQRLALRDMHRITRELLVANRRLVLARRSTEENQVKVLNAMIRALEARDSYTAGHTDRVAAIAVRLAEVMQLPAEQLEVVRVGALLHDIGKIGVRDSVLLKPAALTRDEYEVIMTHTTLGDALLRDVEQFRCVVPIIRYHHERLDGSGYPEGLAGSQIPREARIVAVADILDAITSTRPYRAATSIDSAFEVMSRMQGKELDPEVCEALRTLYRRGRLNDLLQFPEGA